MNPNVQLVRDILSALVVIVTIVLALRKVVVAAREAEKKRMDAATLSAQPQRAVAARRSSTTTREKRIMHSAAVQQRAPAAAAPARTPSWIAAANAITTAPLQVLSIQQIGTSNRSRRRIDAATVRNGFIWATILAPPTSLR